MGWILQEYWGDFYEHHSNTRPQLDSFLKGTCEGNIWISLLCEIQHFEMRQAEDPSGLPCWWRPLAIDWPEYFSFLVSGGMSFINVALKKFLHNCKWKYIFLYKITQSFQTVINHLRTLAGLKSNVYWLTRRFFSHPDFLSKKIYKHVSLTEISPITKPDWKCSQFIVFAFIITTLKWPDSWSHWLWRNLLSWLRRKNSETSWKPSESVIA